MEEIGTNVPKGAKTAGKGKQATTAPVPKDPREEISTVEGKPEKASLAAALDTPNPQLASLQAEFDEMKAKLEDVQTENAQLKSEKQVLEAKLEEERIKAEESKVVVETKDVIIAVKNGQEREFPVMAWKNMPKGKNGWQIKVKTPKEAR